MPVGELFLGAFLQVALDRLASRELLNVAHKWEVDADLKRMKTAVLKLLAVIGDAEPKQFKNKLVRMWLDDLKDIVYDAEDVLDQFETESQRRKVNQLDSPSRIDDSPPQVWDRLTSSINSIKDSFSLRIEIKSKIKEITARLEDIAQEKNNLGLIEGIQGTLAGGSPTGTVEPRLRTSSSVNEPRVYGRDKDVENLIQLLLSDEPSDDNVGVIPIVGLGGVGKTTIAQVLFNNTKVEEYFDLRAWVCVSDVFDVIRIVKVIIKSANGNPCSLQDLLHEQLKKTLEGKKFLLVLDDVWTEKYEDWIALSTPLRAGAKGSKVIITTRSDKVSSITGNLSTHRVELLSEEDCFSLFKRHALQNQNLDLHPALKRIGKEILRKCKGLPLAAKALGGVLRSRQQEDEWEDILNSKIWEVLDKESELGPALWLSYYHLPPHLKPCFIYCGIFPKDYEFEKEELVLLWMAEGFLDQKENLNKRIEQRGEEYFRALVSRPFLQQSSKHNSKFLMHDLIHDLARAAAGKTYFTMDDEEQEKKQVSEKTRHLSYWAHKYEVMNRFEAFCGANKLRTLLSFFSEKWYYNLPSQVPQYLLSRLVQLRVLRLNYYRNIIELPDSIGNLIHLRYLDLSYTHIERLPESTNDLYNLQTFLLSECWSLKELPGNMGNLINLRYLDISGCNQLRKMSCGIGRSMELQMLPLFIVDENIGPGIEELTDLEHLRGKLEISGLETIMDPMHKNINLRNKKHLHTLKFRWDDSNLVVNDSQVKIVAEHVLDHLQPHNNLKKLTIEGYYGTKFPFWLTDPSYCSNLTSLRLIRCKSCNSLPSLGQLPFLEELSISKMPEWKEWTKDGREGEEEFPRLQRLKINDCPNLKTISHCFPALVQLEIYDCGELTTFLSHPSLVQLGSNSFPRQFPSLNELTLAYCGYEALQNVASFCPLTSVNICGISRLTCLPREEAFLQCLRTLQTLDNSECENLTSLWSCNGVRGGGLHHHLTSLRYLSIASCHKLEKLPDGLHNLMFLEELRVKDCPGIETISEMELPSMLKHIEIKRCMNLKSLPEVFFTHTSLERLDVKECSSLDSFSRSSTTTDDITKLKWINISECHNLKFLPEGLHNLTSLEILTIDECQSLTCFPNGGFRGCRIRSISIYNCQRLMSLPDQMHCLKCLEGLRVKRCPRLLSFPEQGLPSTKLKYLEIMDCEDLKYLPNQMNLLTSLEILQIHGCPKLLSFPDGGLSSTNLKYLRISHCKGLNSLVHHMHSLTSLHRLQITNCPSLMTFPESGLPTNLESLVISIDSNTLPLSAWEFQFCRLNFLRELHIFGHASIESFPKWFLPSTLNSLTIRKFPDLKSLSKGLQHLIILESLSISDCPKLASLPDQELPTTLNQLYIYHCPLLKQQWKKKKAEDWPKLSRIGCVEIDYEFIN